MRPCLTAEKERESHKERERERERERKQKQITKRNNNIYIYILYASRNPAALLNSSRLRVRFILFVVVCFCDF